MVANRLLLLPIVMGLVAGCAVETSSPSEVEASSVPSPTLSPLPVQTMALETKTASVDESPDPSIEQATPGVPPPAEHQPPPREDLPTPTPVEMARFDLADRLHTDVALVEAIGVVAREPDAEVMSCLADEPLFERLWRDDQVAVQVEWVSLSVKGNIHHYVALGDLIIYCGETADDRP